MPRNLARYEQFLRLHALVDTLANSRHPLDDTTLITAIRERLGLARLSPRTLHRDCDFLIGCGYPLDRIAVQGPRRNGWSLNRDAVGRIFPAATSVTILELIAFNIARDLLRSFEGTVLWSGIESLRTKLDGTATDGLRRRVETGRSIFQVEAEQVPQFADHPRMLSALATAMVEHRLIDVDFVVDGKPVSGTYVPVRLLIRPPAIRLVIRDADSPAAADPVTIDLTDIRRVVMRDETFSPDPQAPPPPDFPEGPVA